MPRHLLHNATAKSPRASRASDKPDQICIWMWNRIWICIWHSKRGAPFLREFEAKLASAYHEWVKNARRSGKSIYHFSLICLCVRVCMRGCACVTGESLAKTLDNTYLHARKTSTNKCGQVPEWEECNAAHSVANALVMQPSGIALRSIRGGYVMILRI